ncbi:MAG: hypothetical protein ACI4PM_01040 [Butyricicoccus sp.]
MKKWMKQRFVLTAWLMGSVVLMLFLSSGEQILPVFSASDAEEKTLVLDAGHGGCR